MTSSGHRVVPHTADVIIEAWSQSRVRCLEEAVRALIDSFATVEEVAVTKPIPIALEPDRDEALLVSLLEEIIYLVDVLDSVPAGIVLEDAEDGGVAGFIDLVPAEAVHVHGSLPKGVSYADLAFAQQGDRWRCRVTIDV